MRSILCKERRWLVSSETRGERPQPKQTTRHLAVINLGESAVKRAETRTARQRNAIDLRLDADGAAGVSLRWPPEVRRD